jgi:hypothetical protein
LNFSKKLFCLHISALKYLMALKSFCATSTDQILWIKKVYNSIQFNRSLLSEIQEPEKHCEELSPEADRNKNDLLYQNYLRKGKAAEKKCAHMHMLSRLEKLKKKRPNRQRIKLILLHHWGKLHHCSYYLYFFAFRFLGVFFYFSSQL